MNALVRVLAWSIAVALVGLPLVAVLNGWLAADRWPIQRLQVTAEFARVSAEQVSSAVAGQTQVGFFALDTDAVHRAVMSLPWVAEVEVRKQWPDVLQLRIVEHHAVARWGASRLLSDRGELFAAPGSTLVQGLPELSGPDGRLQDVVAFDSQVRAALAGTGIQLRGVRLSPRGSWSLTLADGAKVLLGRTDSAQRLTRLGQYLPNLLASDGRVLERADLRYGNGFALRWQPTASVHGAESLQAVQAGAAMTASKAMYSLAPPQPSPNIGEGVKRRTEV
ncbi:MAG: cell division protein FtsQ/DivIB [Pseudomarimonas sp.]